MSHLDFTKFAPELRAALVALGERIATLEAALRDANLRLDAVGIPGAAILHAPSPTRRRPEQPSAVKPPVMPSMIAVRAGIPENVAQAIRVHAASDANSRNAIGAIRTSTLSYAASTADRLSRMWLDPTQKAAAMTELVDSLPASRRSEADDNLSFESAVDPASGPAAATRTQAEIDEEEIDRLFG